MDSYETILNYIGTTATETGLRVKAYLDTRIYEKSVKISNNEMDRLRIDQHKTLPAWNYTIRPRNGK